MQKREIQTYTIGLNFVDTDLNYETFLGNNECWCYGHLSSEYILLGHPVFICLLAKFKFDFFSILNEYHIFY